MSYSSVKQYYISKNFKTMRKCAQRHYSYLLLCILSYMISQEKQVQIWLNYSHIELSLSYSLIICLIVLFIINFLVIRKDFTQRPFYNILYWLLTTVLLISLLYILLRNRNLLYASEVLWDWGIKITQIYTPSDKMNYIIQYIQYRLDNLHILDVYPILKKYKHLIELSVSLQDIRINIDLLLVNYYKDYILINLYTISYPSRFTDIIFIGFTFLSVIPFISQYYNIPLFSVFKTTISLLFHNNTVYGILQSRGISHTIHIIKKLFLHLFDPF